MPPGAVLTWALAQSRRRGYAGRSGATIRAFRGSISSRAQRTSRNLRGTG
jgi:hypothetical protein